MQSLVPSSTKDIDNPAYSNRKETPTKDDPWFVDVVMRALHSKLAAAAFIVSAAAPAASNPPGGYAQSCRDISVTGTVLRATCKNMAGNWASPSVLPNYAACVGDIFNYDGILKCAGAAPPGGTYRATCSDLNLDNSGNLYGRCKKIDGSRVISTLNVSGCRQNIANIDGHLRCDGVGPVGSYAKTCWNIRTDNATLRAECRTRNGGVKATQLDEVAWHRCQEKGADIANTDGVLGCQFGMGSSAQGGGGNGCPFGNPGRDPNCGVTLNPNPTPPVGPGVPATPPPGTPPCCRPSSAAKPHGAVEPVLVHPGQKQ